MFRRLISAASQSRSAKTVEVFGWLILFEGTIVLFAPRFTISLLGIEPQRPIERGRNLFSLPCSTGQSFPLPTLWFLAPRTARSDFFNSRLRQLSLDTVPLACRTAKIVEENFYE